eukprot:m.747638 g.747638  ORF g.747638 m.747638 type:complete len:877 (-) comp23144_c0_seq2:155-2785(-)
MMTPLFGVLWCAGVLPILGAHGFGGVDVLGYYSWNWGSGCVLKNASIGIAFTGLNDIESAIDGYPVEAGWCCPPLVGQRYLSLGGGNAAGMFTVDIVEAIANDMYLVNESNYSGVVFDAEICIGSHEELVPAFKKAFQAAKSYGLGVIVTVAHSAPYHTDTPEDAVELMKAWVLEGNIDILSPQLYSSGTESAPDFDETYNCKAAGCTWDLYRGARARFVPSIVDETHYGAVMNYFRGALVVEGYLQWAQHLELSHVSNITSRLDLAMVDKSRQHPKASAEPILISTSSGKLQGGINPSGVRYWIGVPYAEPPVDDLRWRDPQPRASWTGVRQATVYADVCAQLATPDTHVKGFIGSEDCLYLNIWAPPACTASAKDCAVMVFIHGGSYVYGGIGPPTGAYNGSKNVLNAGNVIQVTIQYRLNVFGFLGSTAIQNRSKLGSTGNYGILDQQLALQWVQTNIGAFGGDAGNVMVYGESAGAGSTTVHLVSPQSRGLFHKAGLESGAFAHWTAMPLAVAEAQWAGLLQETRCPDVDCLLTIPTADLTRIAMGHAPNVSTFLPVHSRTGEKCCSWSPTVDGVVLPDLPWKLYDNVGDHDILMGFNHDEGTIDVNGILQWDMDRAAFEELAAAEFKMTPAQVATAVRIYGNTSRYSTWYWAATHLAGDVSFVCPTLRAAAAIGADRARKERVLRQSAHADASRRAEPGQRAIRTEQHTPSQRSVGGGTSNGTTATATPALYLYHFNHKPRWGHFSFAGLSGVPASAGVYHASELLFVFDGNPPATHAQAPKYIPAGPPLPNPMPLIGADEELLATTMAYYWTNFARSGSPNDRSKATTLSIEWPPYTNGTPDIINLDIDLLSTLSHEYTAQCTLVNALPV